MSTKIYRVMSDNGLSYEDNTQELVASYTTPEEAEKHRDVLIEYARENRRAIKKGEITTNPFDNGGKVDENFSYKVDEETAPYATFDAFLEDVLARKTALEQARLNASKSAEDETETKIVEESKQARLLQEAKRKLGIE